MQTRDGQIIPTQVRIRCGDALRAKLAELDLTGADIDDAVTWARTLDRRSALIASLS